MNQKELRTRFAHPTPELPVEDVERAQRHYRDALGFDIGWLYIRMLQLVRLAKVEYARS